MQLFGESIIAYEEGKGCIGMRALCHACHGALALPCACPRHQSRQEAPIIAALVACVCDALCACVVGDAWGGVFLVHARPVHCSDAPGLRALVLRIARPCGTMKEKRYLCAGNTLEGQPFQGVDVFW
jgi:hypothetical protein